MEYLRPKPRFPVDPQSDGAYTRYNDRPKRRETDGQTRQRGLLVGGLVYPSATKKSSLEATATSVGAHSFSVSALFLAGSNFLPSTRDGSWLSAESNLNTFNHTYIRLSESSSAGKESASSRCDVYSSKQTVYWILAASKRWIKQTYRKIMHTQNHITGNALVQIE